LRYKPDTKPAWSAFGLGPWLAGLTIAWAACTYIGISVRGVAIGDPYGYTQMAIDLVHHGTPIHTFSLAPRAADWSLPLYATVPVGYNTPDPVTGRAATPWPPGHSILLALGYWLASEKGLYIMTPVLGLIALGTMWTLSLEVLLAWPDKRRFLVAGLAVFTLATSYQQVYWLAVPMADVSSQLFTMLTIYFALKSAHSGTRRVVYAGLSGLALGAAFAMRYTQVLLAFSVVFLILSQCVSRTRPWRDALVVLSACGLCAWLTALPVLIYHAAAFGNPFTTGSYELAYFALGNVSSMFVGMLDDLLAYNEFLFLFPFLLLGVGHTWRTSRRASIALLLWWVAITAFHLPYGRLRIRDLLSVFPAFALLVGMGVDCALHQVQRISKQIAPDRRANLVQGIAIGMIVVLAWARTHQTLVLAANAEFRTFGYLSAEERAAFDEIVQLTNPGAVIATSSNAGGIILYTERDIVRPLAWSEQEWLKFLELAFADGREVYFLMDDVNMGTSFQTMQARYSPSLVCYLPLLYFVRGDMWEYRDVALYRIGEGSRQ